MASLRISFRNRFLFGSLLILIGLYLVNFFPDLLQLGSGIILVSTIVILYSGLKMRLELNKLENKTEKIASGNLKKIGDKKYSRNELGGVEKGFDDTLQQVKILLSTIKQTSDDLAGIAEMLAAGTSEASTSVGKVSTKINQISNFSTEQNRRLKKMKNNLRQHLKDITQASSNISDASYFVGKVARRTNILGLNASIEASKAGKFGTGFNIVAQEIRELSNETKSSADQITESIENINYTIKQTVEELMSETNELVETAQNTAEKSEEVSTATSQTLLPMISEINDTTERLSKIASELNEIMKSFEF